MGKYMTRPPATPDMPKGIPYIVGNEAAERFSYYGMRTILVIFMTKYLLDQQGNLDVMNEAEAKEWFHLFTSAAYFFPVIGAIISDVFLGKYLTILSISLIYCLGHLTLALDDTRIGLALGLALIAIGTGAIKPCVSAHVGDQFGRLNQHRMSRVFGWFYFSINLGAFASTLLTPLLLKHYGPQWAFGVPGILMAIATLVFWMGRNVFVHIPPAGPAFFRETFGRDGLRAILNLSVIYVFVAVFWSLFDQSSSAWVLQATRMDREVLGVEWLPSQIQAVNPLLILLFIPLFSYMFYPLIGRVFPLTPLRKMSIGFFIVTASFAVPALVEENITGGRVLRTVTVKEEAEAPGDAEGEETGAAPGTEEPAGVAEEDQDAGIPKVDSQTWGSQRLLDGTTDGPGWSSPRQPRFPIDVVIRLRERRPWEIASLRVAPDAYREYTEEEWDSWTPERAARLRRTDEARQAREVALYVGETRKGPWAEVGRLELEAGGGFRSVDFEPVRAEYVKVRVLSNHGGNRVTLGEVEAVAEGSSPPPEAHDHAAAVWPNVAAIGHRPTILWQFLAYALLTAAEIMISITGLEFSYTQSPRKMKSFIMALWLLTVTLGNLFTAAVNHYIQNDDGSSALEGAAYYWFFTTVVGVAAVLFVFVAMLYKGQTYIQDEEPPAGPEEEPHMPPDPAEP